MSPISYLMVGFVGVFNILNENIRNEWKIAKKSRGCPYKINSISLTNCPSISNLVQLGYIRHALNSMVRMEDYLIYIFININENIRNKRKINEIIKGCTYKSIHISAAIRNREKHLVSY